MLYAPLLTTRIFFPAGNKEFRQTSMLIVPDPQKRTAVYSFGSPWTIFTKSLRIPSIMDPNSFSLGQMSGTTCASLTVSVVVDGPGFNRMFLFICIYKFLRNYSFIIMSNSEEYSKLPLLTPIHYLKETCVRLHLHMQISFSTKISFKKANSKIS